MSTETVSAINRAQLAGQEPLDISLVKEPELRALIQRFDLMHEMFAKPDQVQPSTIGHGDDKSPPPSKY